MTFAERTVSSPLPPTPGKVSGPEEAPWDLPAEAISVRIRWFGLCFGYVLVNFLRPSENRPYLNAILTLGAVYALLDTYYSVRGRIFLNRVPLFVSLMEAVFIGLLCRFDVGLESPFRFYYFLSLLVCAVRHAPATTYATYAMHAASMILLAVSLKASSREQIESLVLMLLLLGWVTWASTSLAQLLQTASRKLTSLNAALRENQQLLERRIDERSRQLQESQALLVQHEKQAAFGLLAAGIAHEVGNPLAAISSLVQLMVRKDVDEQTAQRLQMIDDQLRRIQRTLRELVDFSRPASVERTSFDIHQAIDEALSIAKYYKRRKGKQIQTEYTPDAPRFHGVRDQVVQVFLNLILNALDATDEGGTITISTCVEASGLRVDVRDNGHGISDGDRQKIFEPYFTTKSTGTGLGLFVCSRVLESAGGSIKLFETSHRGTTFSVRLPLEQGRVAETSLSEVREMPLSHAQPTGMLNDSA